MNGDKASSVHMREVIFNIIVFIPAGVYFTTMSSKKNILLTLSQIQLADCLERYSVDISGFMNCTEDE